MMYREQCFLCMSSLCPLSLTASDFFSQELQELRHAYGKMRKQLQEKV